VFSPKRQILGSEIAGEVVATGEGVTHFNIGDLVFAHQMFGAHAEFVSIPESGVVVHAPDGFTMEELASVPNGALSALHFLKKSELRKDQKILIYGASGSVGSYAVQIAKAFGAEVTAVASTRNQGFLKDLGADKVRDYTQGTVFREGDQFDLILDTVGKTRYAQMKPALKPNGTYTVVAFQTGHFVDLAWVNIQGKHRMLLSIVEPEKAELEYLANLMTVGKLRPIIDRKYPFTEIVEAHGYVEQGHKRGNVVLIF
jgi:NADPH:quinone reductase-like Zn-dependent oxidoreductase